MQLWVFHLHYKSTFSESLLKPRLRRAVSTYLSLHTFWKETLISCELHFFRIYLTIPKEEFRVYCEFYEFNPIHFHPGIAEIMKEFQKTRNQLPKYPSCIRHDSNLWPRNLETTPLNTEPILQMLCNRDLGTFSSQFM